MVEYLIFKEAGTIEEEGGFDLDSTKFSFGSQLKSRLSAQNATHCSALVMHWNWHLNYANITGEQEGMDGCFQRDLDSD